MVTATEFKAKCLSLINEIEEQGSAITVTRRGRPVAVLGPVANRSLQSPKNSWAGKARIEGDIVNIDSSELWEAAQGK